MLFFCLLPLRSLLEPPVAQLKQFPCHVYVVNFNASGGILAAWTSAMHLVVTRILSLFAGLLQVCRATGIEPSDIQYVEAHGTGTVVGDSQELMAIDELYGAGAGHTPEEPLLIGSVKSNMGHCEGCSGLAGDTAILSMCFTSRQHAAWIACFMVLLSFECILLFCLSCAVMLQAQIFVRWVLAGVTSDSLVLWRVLSLSCKSRQQDAIKCMCMQIWRQCTSKLYLQNLDTICSTVNKICAFAGLIKVCLSYENGLLPGNLHYKQPNPNNESLKTGILKVHPLPSLSP